VHKLAVSRYGHQQRIDQESLITKSKNAPASYYYRRYAVDHFASNGGKSCPFRNGHIESRRCADVEWRPGVPACYDCAKDVPNSVLSGRGGCECVAGFVGALRLRRSRDGAVALAAAETASETASETANKGARVPSPTQSFVGSCVSVDSFGSVGTGQPGSNLLESAGSSGATTAMSSASGGIEKVFAPVPYLEGGRNSAGPPPAVPRRGRCNVENSVFDVTSGLCKCHAPEYEGELRYDEASETYKVPFRLLCQRRLEIPVRPATRDSRTDPSTKVHRRLRGHGPL